MNGGLILVLGIAMFISIGFLLASIVHRWGDKIMFKPTGSAFLTSVVTWPMVLLIVVVYGAAQLIGWLSRAFDSYAKFLGRER